MPWCSACHRRAPAANAEQKAAAKPKVKAATKPAPRPKQNAVPKRCLDIDYSKWANFKDSDDEEEVAPKEESKPLPRAEQVEAPVEAELSRWSGEGFTYMEEFKKIAAKNLVDMKRQLGGSKETTPTNDNLPTDYMEDVGIITAEKLASYGCENDRILVSVYGDIFDVSSRADQYRHRGSLAWRSGKDITWRMITGKVEGKSDSSNCNRFFDFLSCDRDHAQRYLQLICQQLVMFEDDFGKPLGKLIEYAKDYDLPPPPVSETSEHECKQQ